MSALRKLNRPEHRLQPLWKLEDLIKKESISLEAPYQRDIVWHKSKMCSLIDSIMNNYYIPPLVFAVRKIRNRSVRVCIDGKQRLTSVMKFMNNEIPYIEVVDGVRHEYYYSARNDRESTFTENREYLSKSAREQFNAVEFVCVEYVNLDLQAETEIFARVQLGVPLTAAEKLKANLSPSAGFCEKLYEAYRMKIKTVLPDTRSRLYQHIAALVLTIRDNAINFPASRVRLEQFLQNQSYEPTEDLRKKCTEALDIIAAIAKSDHFDVFTHVRGDSKMILPIEFICFGYYLSQCRRRSRSIQQFSEDCNELRTYIWNHVDLPRLGTPTYQVALKWIDEKLNALGMIPVSTRLPAEPSLTPDTENHEEEDDGLVDSFLAHLQHNQFLEDKPVPVCIGPDSSSAGTGGAAAPMPSNHHPPRLNRPTARRGAKMPRYH
ncbi:hypothetical protein BX666DRAFT_2124516 [Dichotomocladium elegans]|nr:hypothetical protein BX666DRAFT_2124516 [Dichotomocladium elegans]